MNNLAQIGLLVGYTWGCAGMLVYPGVSWKPGAALAAVSFVWLMRHEALPNIELIEGLALLIFFVLSVARDKLYPAKAAEAPKEK